MLLFCVGKKVSPFAAKAILLAFEGTSDLRINLYKSLIICLNMQDFEASLFASWLNCKKGELPISYLGLSLCDQKPPKHCWLPLLGKVNFKLASWKGKHLSWGGRVILLNFVLSSLPLYFMSVFRLPKWVLSRIDQLRHVFLWKGEETVSRFYCLVNWDSVCWSKEQGSLGIKSLEQVNLALLTKWAWKFNVGSTSPWWKQIKNVYYMKKTFGLRSKKNHRKMSPIWKDVCKHHNAFWNCLPFKLGDGSKIHFWEDQWCGPSPLAFLFDDLYPLVVKQNCSVASQWSKRSYFRGLKLEDRYLFSNIDNW